MSPALIKMWVALAALGLMFIAVMAIMLSRSKLKGIISILVSTFAYLCMFVAGVLMLLVVFTGPTN
ncbi:DUF2768 domain-containing protein [Guptibacillus hwajinpoensis]|uniref:NAD(FAD)-dependent dehydrogenase n=1 Tax=Guptibacillus hwajinpoensis TaxID=208199 RepID=A0A0J6CPI0_9BACL|nr:DUF2768 domain-containing protein [Alkalihalobacillus macyae]KMM38146.1 hypothetical protein AB986_02125 [Alkalihalobacillus macyae]MDP4549707.1 DUF2768 domain-containing protein [Alkalihalobacillus macyae]